MYWEKDKDKHLVLEPKDIREGARGKSVHDTVMADFNLEVKDPIHFANHVTYFGKVFKNRLTEETKTKKDIVLHLKDLRFDAKDVLLRNLKITDFKISKEDMDSADSIVLQFVLKDRDHSHGK